jgi:hypothetical protein
LKVKSQNRTWFSVNWFYKQEILKTLLLKRLSLYSDYINKFGNIDIDYDLTLELVFNEYVKTNIGLHISMMMTLRLKKRLTENRLP